MRIPATSRAASLFTLVLITHSAFAQYSKITPCVTGAGHDMCGQCDDSQAIKVTSWSETNWVHNFSMTKAATDEKHGYKVFWNVEQPGPGCNILLFDELSQPDGTNIQGLTGRIRLSAPTAGCYLVPVYTKSIGAGACCWDECVNIGAVPGKPKSKRNEIIEHEILSKPLSRVKRAEISAREHAHSTTQDIPSKALSMPEKRNNNIDPSGHFDSWGPKQTPVAEWKCSSTPTDGHTYRKSGRQQLDAYLEDCQLVNGCSETLEVSTSVASTISIDKGTTFTNSVGKSVSYTGGVMIFDGPNFSITTSYDTSFAKEASTSTGTSTDITNATSVSLRWDFTVGYQYRLWGAPVYDCTTLKLSCEHGGETSIERCVPATDGNGKPLVDQGVMLVGIA